jgi:DNA-binding transcriptional ArsR family regulator
MHQSMLLLPEHSLGILQLKLFQIHLIQMILEYIVEMAFSSATAPDFLKLLAHDLRWRILTLLARSDYNGQEFMRLLGQPQNLVSYHLRKLHEQHLVTEHRSTADERSIYYSLDLDTVRSLYQQAGMALHPAVTMSEESPSPVTMQSDQPPACLVPVYREQRALSDGRGPASPPQPRYRRGLQRRKPPSRGAAPPG